jgi:tripartite-type tricarboxylate transporter receptor subunit TctC
MKSVSAARLMHELGKTVIVNDRAGADGTAEIAKWTKAAITAGVQRE